MNGYIGLRVFVFSAFLISHCACQVGDVLTGTRTILKYDASLSEPLASVNVHCILSVFPAKTMILPFQIQLCLWIIT